MPWARNGVTGIVTGLGVPVGARACGDAGVGAAVAGGATTETNDPEDADAVLGADEGASSSRPDTSMTRLPTSRNPASRRVAITRVQARRCRTRPKAAGTSARKPTKIRKPPRAATSRTLSQLVSLFYGFQRQ